MAKKVIAVPDLIREEITRLFPEARCELRYTTNIELLIAIILSAQTTDESVNRVTEKLFKKYHSVDEYAEAEIDDLQNCIRNLGLYKNKANFIKQTAMAIRDRFQGQIPKEQALLESLPGVGRKTANVYLSEWHHIPRIAVDTHVSRVSVRLGLAEENDTVEQIEQKLMKAFEERHWIEMHHKLIFFGRYFCTAKKPKCTECPLRTICIKPLY